MSAKHSVFLWVLKVKKYSSGSSRLGRGKYLAAECRVMNPTLIKSRGVKTGVLMFYDFTFHSQFSRRRPGGAPGNPCGRSISWAPSDVQHPRHSKRGSPCQCTGLKGHTAVMALPPQSLSPSCSRTGGGLWWPERQSVWESRALHPHPPTPAPPLASVARRVKTPPLVLWQRFGRAFLSCCRATLN